MKRLRDPRVFLPVLGVAVVLLATFFSDRWMRGSDVAQADYVGTIEVTANDAQLYRDVPFEWRVAGVAGAFRGNGTAHVRIDSSGERTFVCGWLESDKTGASVRASRWLSAARLKVGELWLSATFIASSDKVPGNGLSAGCARIDVAGAHPPADAPLKLEGPPVQE